MEWNKIGTSDVTSRKFSESRSTANYNLISQKVDEHDPLVAPTPSFRRHGTSHLPRQSDSLGNPVAKARRRITKMCMVRLHISAMRVI